MSTTIRSPKEHALHLSEVVDSGNRGAQHGAAYENMAHTANLWNAYMGANLFKPHDVAQMLNLVKVSRSKCGNYLNTDHYLDGGGYQVIAAHCIDVETSKMEAAIDKAEPSPAKMEIVKTED